MAGKRDRRKFISLNDFWGGGREGCGPRVQFRKIMIIGLEIIIESDFRKGTLHCRFRLLAGHTLRQSKSEKVYFNGKLNEREEGISAAVNDLPGGGLGRLIKFSRTNLWRRFFRSFASFDFYDISLIWGSEGPRTISILNYQSRLWVKKSVGC